MKQTLLALGLSLAVAATASAQPLDRRPVTSLALLKKQINRGPSAVVVPVAASIPVETAPVYNSESARIFATKVHPILMNACAGCHGRNDHAGPYKLKRLDEGYENGPGVERNLLATVKQLDRADPGVSPFLVKAVAAHGKSKDAPLFSKAHPAYKYLEVWAYWATMRDGAAMPTSIPLAVVKRPEAAPIKSLASPGKPSEPTKLPAPPSFATEVKTSSPDRVNPDDPFDPGAFNRAAHPRK